MGAKRKTEKHLPPRVYVRRGKYYFVELTGRWIPLGGQYAKAMAKWGELTDAHRQCVTMGDVIDRYRLEVLPKKAESTQEHEHAQLDRLKLVFGHMLPDSITSKHVRGYRNERMPYKTSARQELNLLSHVFSMAIGEWDAATQNPVKNVKRPKPKRKKRYISHDEFETVWQMANDRMRIAMELALLTGLRRGDILNLTRDSLTDQGLLVTPSKTKERDEDEWDDEDDERDDDDQSKTLLIAYSPALKEVLKRALSLPPQVGPGNFILRTRNGTGYTARGFSANWQRLMGKAVKAGIKRFTFHNIRAKNASDEPSLEKASERLGHASVETTKRIYRRNVTRTKPLW